MKILNAIMFLLGFLGFLQTCLLFYQIWFVWGPLAFDYVDAVYVIRVVWGFFGSCYFFACLEVKSQEILAKKSQQTEL